MTSKDAASANVPKTGPPLFTETETVLQVFDSKVGATPESFLEEVLNKLKHKDAIKTVNLGDDWMEDATPFDFGNFSEQLAQVWSLSSFEVSRQLLRKTCIKSCPFPSL